MEKDNQMGYYSGSWLHGLPSTPEGTWDAGIFTDSSGGKWQIPADIVAEYHDELYCGIPLDGTGVWHLSPIDPHFTWIKGFGCCENHTDSSGASYVVVRCCQRWQVKGYFETCADAALAMKAMKDGEYAVGELNRSDDGSEEITLILSDDFPV